MTFSVVEEANTSAGDNRACSDGGSGEDECSGSKRVRVRCWGSSEMGPLYNGDV